MLASKLGIFRDPADGPCDVFMAMDDRWKDRVVDETAVHNGKFQMG